MTPKRYWGVPALIILGALELALSHQQYWVTGTKSYGIFIFFVALPTLMLAALYRYIAKISSYGILVIGLVYTSYVISDLYSMTKTWQDIENLMGELRTNYKEKGTYPKTLADIGFSFNDSSTEKRIKFYYTRFDDAVIGFHVGDESVCYNFSSKRGWSFDDD